MTPWPWQPLTRDQWVDIALAFGLFVLGWAADGTSLGPQGALLFALLFSVPLAWRRTRPELAALGIVPGHLLQLALVPQPVLLNVTVPLVLYAVAAYGEERWTRPWLYAGLGASALAGLRWGASGSGSTIRLGDVVAVTGACAAVVAASWFMGAWRRQRVAGERAERERRVAEEKEKVQAVRLAATEERQRIAREMHDIVAHSLSVIVVQADGARYVLTETPGDPQDRLDAAARAVDIIQATARAALTETRRLVGVLHDDTDASGPDRGPAATLADIPALIQNLTDAGRRVTLEVVGDPAAHPPLGAVGELTAYRVVQEALTNVIKHAGPGASARVVLDHLPGAGLVVTVRDDGVGAGATDGQGHGHHGMRARVDAMGGSVSLGNHPDGGFEVRAFLPAANDSERYR